MEFGMDEFGRHQGDSTVSAPGPVYLESEDARVIIKETEEMKEKVFSKILEWIKENQLFSGESVIQTDKGALTSQVLLADILDAIIQPEVEWKGQGISWT
jgi:hypothetical protein